MTINIEQIAKDLEMRVWSVSEILYSLVQQPETLKQELSRKFNLPKSHLTRLLQSLREYLTEDGGKIVSLKKEAFPQIIAAIKEHQLDENAKEIEDKIRKTLLPFRNERPSAKREYDQFYALDETVAKRVNLLRKNGDLLERDIAFLGDDDLTSVATALMGKTGKISVFEIDKDIINIINKAKVARELNIELVEHDLTNPLPNSFTEKYDTVFTDPPYTPDGIRLFLNIGISLLKKSPLSRLYFCYGTSIRAKEREVEIQKIVAELGLALKDKIDGFNKYHGAESIGNTSSLYVCDVTEKTKPMWSKGERIYTYQ